MNNMRYWINAWAQPTVRWHMKDPSFLKGPWGGTYLQKPRGADVSIGDEIFDVQSKSGQMGVMTDITAAKIHQQHGTGYFARTQDVTDPYIVKAEPGANPIRFDTFITPAQLKRLRYINVAGELKPFAVDQNGLLTSMSLAASVIEVPESTAKVLRACYGKQVRKAA